MATTQNTYTGNGSTTNYSFTFEYLKQSDVKVTLDTVATTAFTFANATTLSFTSAPANNVAIRIFRDTAIDTLSSTFFPGSAIKAEDLNQNFTQSLYVTQESETDVGISDTTANAAKATADGAVTTANSAVTTANSAVTTANSAVTTANASTATANTANTNASAAVTTANAASATANTASTNAASAVTTANTANTTAGTAVTTANTAVSTANSAVSSATTANTTAGNAVTTANAATTAAAAAQTTANSAVTTANTANTTAGSAVTTANSATTTANTANTNATNAVSVANAASAAVSSAVLFTLIANVAAIPGSPSNNDYIEIGDSTGIQSFSPLSGLPSGFVGASGLTVRLRYQTSGTTWVFMSYFANDSETRYLTKNIPVVTGDSTNGSGQITLNCENNSHGVKIKGPPHSAAATYTLTLPNDAGSNGQSLTTNGSGTLTWATPATGSTDSISEGNTSAEVIDAGSDGHFVVTTEGGEALRVDSSGRLLIGTTTSDNAVSYADNLVIGTTSGDNGMTIVSGTSDAGSINFSDGTGANETKGIIQYHHSSNNLTFYVNSSEALRVDSSGRVLVGTSTTPTAGNGQYSNLVIQGYPNTPQGAGHISLQRGQAAFGANNQIGLINFGDNTGASYAGIECYADADSGANDYPGRLVFSTTADGASAPTERMQIDSTGKTTIQGITVGLGGSAVSTNTAVGSDALAANTTGVSNVAIGNNALESNTTGTKNTSVGLNSLKTNTTGNSNSAIGRDALYSNTTANFNTATGYQSLRDNTTGGDNTATGYKALYSNTTGNEQVAFGYTSLYSNTTGGYNTAYGAGSLYYNTTGTHNVANGYRSIYSNTTGSSNTATGPHSLYSNTTGTDNTATGKHALYYNTTGSDNVASGLSALKSNTTGASNTAVGNYALKENTTGKDNVANGYQALYSNTDGEANTAIGMRAMYSTTTGDSNVAIGWDTLKANTTGSVNTAVGQWALYSNTTANFNTATGFSALHSNTTGSSNVACGSSALYYNTTGNYNTATGLTALYSTTTGSNNTASGYEALKNNTTASENTAFGSKTLEDNTTGASNTAVGSQALKSNTTGYNNAAVGQHALYSNTTGHANTGVGQGALYACTGIGKGNTGIGHGALASLTTGRGNTEIGGANINGSWAPVFTVTTQDNRFVAGSAGITNAYVQVSWTVVSDERDKMNFAPVPYGLDFVNQLKPTAYQFKVDRDTETPHGPVRYGFKAQDILALEGDNPVIIDTEDADHLKYKGEHLVPVLVNAVQELTAMVKELQTEIETLKG